MCRIHSDVCHSKIIHDLRHDVAQVSPFLHSSHFSHEDFSLSDFGWNPLLRECSYLRSYSVWCFKMLLWGSEILLLLSSSCLCVLAVFNRVHRGNAPFSTRLLCLHKVSIVSTLV